MGPLPEADGHDAPGLIDELVPDVAAVINDIVVRGVDTVRQPVVAHELPDVLDRLRALKTRIGAHRSRRFRLS